MEAAAISILCHVHPQLSIANIYVKLPETLKGNVTCWVKGNSLHLQINNLEFKLNFPELVQLLDGTSFQPTVEDNYIHLRMPSNGSNSIDLIRFPRLKSDFFDKDKNKMWTPQTGTKNNVKCNHCSTVLVESIEFDRVLPLPGDSWSEAASDWYCHLHGDTDVHKKLTPRRTDCLYGSSFYSFPLNIFNSSPLTHCPNCQSQVGRLNDDTINFWCHSVRWSVANEEMKAPTALQAFHFTLKEALNEQESFFGRKLVFKSGNEALTIWLVGDNGFTMEGASRSEDLSVDLVKGDKQRVLFKFERDQYKMASTNVSEHVVSGMMLQDIVRLLDESCLLLPPTCRTVNDFSIGFLSFSA